MSMDETCSRRTRVAFAEVAEADSTAGALATNAAQNIGMQKTLSVAARGRERSGTSRSLSPVPTGRSTDTESLSPRPSRRSQYSGDGQAGQAPRMSFRARATVSARESAVVGREYSQGVGHCPSVMVTSTPSQAHGSEFCRMRSICQPTAPQLITPETFDCLLDAMEEGLTNINCQAVKSSMVKLPRAELDLLKAIERARDFMIQVLESSANRSDLINIFSENQCERICRARAVCEAAEFSPMNSKDPRPQNFLRSCAAIEKVLVSEFGLQEELKNMQAFQRDKHDRKLRALTKLKAVAWSMGAFVAEEKRHHDGEPPKPSSPSKPAAPAAAPKLDMQERSSGDGVNRLKSNLTPATRGAARVGAQPSLAARVGAQPSLALAAQAGGALTPAAQKAMRNATMRQGARPSGWVPGGPDAAGGDDAYAPLRGRLEGMEGGGHNADAGAGGIRPGGRRLLPGKKDAEQLAKVSEGEDGEEEYVVIKKPMQKRAFCELICCRRSMKMDNDDQGFRSIIVDGAD